MVSSNISIHTANLSPKLADALVAELQTIFPDSEHHNALLLSADPPQWVQIIASVSNWTTVFQIAAAAYLKRLSEHLATATWENRSKIAATVLNAAEGSFSLLRKLFCSINSANEMIGHRLGFRVGLPRIDGKSIILFIQVDTEPQFLEQFSRFVCLANSIDSAARRVSESEHAPGYDIFCFCDESGGFLLKWQRCLDLRGYQQQFDCNGVDVGGPVPSLK